MCKQEFGICFLNSQYFELFFWDFLAVIFIFATPLKKDSS